MRKLFKGLLFDNGSVLTVFDRQFGIMKPPGLQPTSEIGCNLEWWQLLWPLYWRVTGIKTAKKISKQFRSVSENLVKMFWYGTILFIEKLFSFNAQYQMPILKWGRYSPCLCVCVIKLRFYSQPDSGSLTRLLWVHLPLLCLDEIRATWL